jgi:hypothetical protein
MLGGTLIQCCITFNAIIGTETDSIPAFFVTSASHHIAVPPQRNAASSYIFAVMFITITITIVAMFVIIIIIIIVIAFIILALIIMVANIVGKHTLLSVFKLLAWLPNLNITTLLL